MVALFIGFYALAPAVVGIALLPRYNVQIFPFVLFLVVAGIRRVGRQTAAVAALGLVSIFFAMNGYGRFYPNNDLNIMPLIERSESYADLHATHLAEISAAAKVAAERPVFYELLDHYRMTYPRLGYVEEPVLNGTLVRGATSWDNLDAYPDRFALLPEWDGGGPRTLFKIWGDAERDPRWTVNVTEFTQGSFTSRIVVVDRTDDGT
jgi:hypothetical protein